MLREVPETYLRVAAELPLLWMSRTLDWQTLSRDSARFETGATLLRRLHDKSGSGIESSFSRTSRRTRLS